MQGVQGVQADREDSGQQAPQISLPRRILPRAPESIQSLMLVIAVDPHNASWTAVAVTVGLIPAGAVRVEANRAGYRQPRRFADP